MSYWASQDPSNVPRRQEDGKSAKIILNNVSFQIHVLKEIGLEAMPFGPWGAPRRGRLPWGRA